MKYLIDNYGGMVDKYTRLVYFMLNQNNINKHTVINDNKK